MADSTAKRDGLTDVKLDVLGEKKSPRGNAVTPSGLRVVIATATFHVVDGVTITLRKIIRNVKMRGGKVLLLTAPPPGGVKEPGTEHVESIPILSCCVGQADYKIGLRLGKDVEEKLAAFRPHVVHITVPDFACYAAGQWARENQIPLIATWHSNIHDYTLHWGLVGTLIRPFMLVYFRAFYQAVGITYVPSELMRRKMIGEGFQSKEIGNVLKVWGRGVDCEKFHPSKRDEAFRTKHGFAKDNVVVLWVGRCVVEKRPDVYIQVMKFLTKRFPDKVGERQRPRGQRTTVGGAGAAAQAQPPTPTPVSTLSCHEPPSFEPPPASLRCEGEGPDRRPRRLLQRDVRRQELRGARVAEQRRPPSDLRQLRRALLPLEGRNLRERHPRRNGVGASCRRRGLLQQPPRRVRRERLRHQRPRQLRLPGGDPDADQRRQAQGQHGESGPRARRPRLRDHQSDGPDGRQLRGGGEYPSVRAQETSHRRLRERRDAPGVPVHDDTQARKAGPGPVGHNLRYDRPVGDVPLRGRRGERARALLCVDDWRRVGYRGAALRGPREGPLQVLLQDQAEDEQDPHPRRLIRVYHHPEPDPRPRRVLVRGPVAPRAPLHPQPGLERGPREPHARRRTLQGEYGRLRADLQRVPPLVLLRHPRPQGLLVRRADGPVRGPDVPLLHPRASHHRRGRRLRHLRR
mmetsp:Transcript_4405/g.10337  ORF Transcript_4405/g.10337 Transcript_4405/m.10337 type:complete len:687 (-) Transcript_4405:719-2779(-)